MALYKPRNMVGSTIATGNSFVHGTDTQITLTDSGDFDDAGGYIRIDDGSQFALYEYTGLNSNTLTGLTPADYIAESTASYTFSEGTPVTLEATADLWRDIIDILNGDMSWALQKFANITGIDNFKSDIAANLSAGIANRICFETDTGRVLYDDGTSFIELGLSESEISLGNLGSLNAGSNPITSVTDPSNAQDVATKNYVDALEQGLDVKDSVRVVSDGTNFDLTSSVGVTIDGVTPTDDDRILLKDQTTASENGIYTASNATNPDYPSNWVRASDADIDSEITAGMYTWVEEGTNNSDTGYILTSDNPITVGTTSLTFTKFSGAGQITAGDGLSKTGDTLDHDPASVHESGGALALTFGNLASVIGVSGIKMDTAVNLTAGTADRLCLETDTGRVLYDNGASFVELGLSESQIGLGNLGSLDAGGGLLGNGLFSSTNSFSGTRTISSSETMSHQLASGESLTITGTTTVNGNLQVYEL